MIIDHSESHHYDLEAEMILAKPPGTVGDYQPYVVGVSIARGRVWRVITVGYAIEPHYGLSGTIVREEWSAPELRTSDRALPLRQFLDARKHAL